MTDFPLPQARATLTPTLDQESPRPELHSMGPGNDLVALQQTLRSELQKLVSLEPGHWSAVISESEGRGFEASLGANQLIVETNNTTIKPLISLIEEGHCGPLYFNNADTILLEAESATLKRGHFRPVQGNPIVLIQGHLPEDAISPNIVFGPSPFSQRMHSDSELSLESVKRIGFVTPARFDIDGDLLSPTDIRWGQRYLANMELLSESGITASPDSPGEAFQATLARKIAEQLAR